MESLDIIKVSIIIPVYNVEKYIEDCLLSVINQSYNNIECIFVDDCTKDNSIDIINKRLAEYKGPIKFRIISHKINMGLSAARNTGIRNSKGDYLFFLDSDDEITSDAISNLVKLSNSGKVDCVVGNVEVYGESSQVQLKTHLLSSSLSVLESTNEILKSYYNNEWYVMAWNKLINKDFLIYSNLFFPEGLLHEDQYWSYKLALSARNMSFCHNITYIYKIRGNSITGKIKQKNINSLIEIILKNQKLAIIHNSCRYALPKLRSTINFTIRNICKADLEPSIKLQLLNKLKESLRSREKISMPVDIKDALRIIIYKLNNKLILYIYK